MSLAEVIKSAGNIRRLFDNNKQPQEEEQESDIFSGKPFPIQKTREMASTRPNWNLYVGDSIYRTDFFLGFNS